MGTTRRGADRGGSGSRTVAGTDGTGTPQLLAFAQGAGNQAFGALVARQTLARQEDGGGGYEASSGDSGGGGAGGGYEAAPAGGGSAPAGAGGGAGPTGPPTGWESPGDGASTGGTGYEQSPAETHSEIQPAPETQGDWKDQPTGEEATGRTLEGAAVEVHGHAKKAEAAAQQAEAAGHPQVAQALRENAESLRAHAGNLAGGNGSGDLQRLARETEAKANDAERSGAPRELVEAVRQSARDARAAAGIAAGVALKQRGGGPPAIQ